MLNNANDIQVAPVASSSKFQEILLVADTSVDRGTLVVDIEVTAGFEVCRSRIKRRALQTPRTIGGFEQYFRMAPTS